MAPGKHFIYVRVIAFKDSLHAAIDHIPHPAGKVKIFGHVLCCRAEKYSLHPAADKNMNALRYHLPISFKNSFSFRTAIPNELALSSLEPGSIPATT